MSAKELLDRIERSGLVEVKTLIKLRREIQLKGHKPKAVIKYLVAKGHLTDDEGAAFLEGEIPLRSAEAGGFAVQQAAEREFDTDDLTGIRLAKPVSTPTTTSAGKRNGGSPVPHGPTRHYQPNELEGTTASAHNVVEVPVAVAVRADLDAPFYAQPAPGYASTGADDAWDAPVTDNEHREKLTFAGKRDKSDQWKTRWLYVGSGTLALLLIALAVLAWYMTHISADQMLGQADSEYNANNFSSAGPTYEKFIERFPRNEKVNYARVRAFHCRLVIPFGMKNYGEVLSVSNEWLPKLQDLPEFSNIHEDLARLLIQTTYRMTQFAMAQKNIEDVKRELARAQEANALVENPVYVTSVERRKAYNVGPLEQIENNIRTIEGLIKKEEVFRDAVIEIERFAAQGQTGQAFQVFTRLTRTYGDLGARKELREAMARVSESEARLVRPAELTLATTTTDVAPVYASKVLLLSRRGSSTTDSGELLPFIMNGNVYVADGATGSLLWHRHLGWESRIAPIWTDPNERRDLLICDQRTQDVMRINARTGELIWKTTIGRAFAQPTATVRAIYVATDDGLVIALDPATGRPSRSVQIPKRLTVPVEANDQLPVVFVAGYDSNIYILDAETLECRSVFYLGHSIGAVAISPLYWSGHLVVTLNGSDYCELLVLRSEEEGRELRRVQLIRLASGPVTLPPIRLGRLVLYVSENGQIKLVEMTPTEPETPVRVLAEQKFDGFGGQEVFVSTEASDLWIAAKGIMHFRILRSQGQINREKVVSPLDTFLGVLGKQNNRVISLRQRGGARQVRLAGGDAISLGDLWSVDFGGVLAGPPIVMNNRLVAISAQGDVFAIDADSVRDGEATQLLHSSEIDAPLLYLQNAVLPDGRIVCVGESGRGDVLSIEPGLVGVQSLRLASPADAMACPPSVLGDSLLVASLKGQVLRVNPVNGRLVGAPFQPPLAPGQEVRWNAPALVGADGVLINDGDVNAYLLRAEGNQALLKVGEVVATGKFIGPMVAIGDVGCGVTRSGADDALMLLNLGSELSVSRTVPLPARVIAGPWSAGQHIILAADDGMVYAFDSSGELKWRVASADSRLTSASVTTNGNTLLVWENGRMMSINATGEVVRAVELNESIRHGAVLFGDYYAVGTLDGGIIFVEKDRL